MFDSHVSNEGDFIDRVGGGGYCTLACEQAPKMKNRRAERAERGMGANSIFAFALYPAWKPVHRLLHTNKVRKNIKKALFSNKPN